MSRADLVEPLAEPLAEPGDLPPAMGTGWLGPGPAGDGVARPPRAGAGIAIGRRAGRAQVTALVLSLRRRAEADAQEQLRQVRGQLEAARQAQAAAQKLLAQAEQERERLSGRQARNSGPPGSQPMPAELLASQSERLVRQRQLVRERQRQLDALAAPVQALLHEQAELHAALRLCLARREAAELYEAEERREGRRAKAQRQRTLEEEVRDRFLSAQRQAKAPRR